MTDKERLDWLEKPDRTWTFWLGASYDFNSYLVWPIYPGTTNIREQIDKAIEKEKQ